MSERPGYLSADAGDIITFGSCEQDGRSDNGKEPIEWIVLDRKDDQALLLSRYALDRQSYNSPKSSAPRETSSIRQWLNSNFLNDAFTPEQQKYILKKTVSADKNPFYETVPGNDTEDMVFLLSINEAERYLSNDSSRQAQATAYAVSKGAYKHSNRNTRWWLRSPGLKNELAARVCTDGSYFIGNYVNGSDAVRPALWINPGSDIF